LWLDRRKRRTVTIKVDDTEYEIIKDIADALGVPLGEAVRRAIWVFRILYDKDLTLDDALIPSENNEYLGNRPLSDVLKPIPELSALLGLELKIWRKQALQAMNRGEPS
jgi:hypothetical protein